PIDAEALGEEVEDIAALVAHEAVVHRLLRRHGEVAMRALMEGTRAAVVRALALQLDVLTDDADDVGALAHALDRLVGDHANTATVTPAPPSFHAPMRNSRTRVSLRSISFTTS